VPRVAKPCIFLGSCSGDLGDTEVLWLGKPLCVSKASGIVKVFGALETALAYLNLAALKCERQRKCLTRLYWSLQNLGFYLSTGEERYFAQSLHMLQRGIHCLKPLLPDTPLGWIYCLDECCGYVNSARSWVRWVERRITAVEEGRKAILVLNHLANALFEAMRTANHGVKIGNRLVVPQTQPDAPAPPCLDECPTNGKAE